MANTAHIKLLVHWGDNHRRHIHIRASDSLSDIERSCFDAFALSPHDETNLYQIQFYDRNSQVYIDLWDETMDDFRQLLRRLSSLGAPLQAEKEWHLKFIPSRIRTWILFDRIQPTTFHLLGPANVQPDIPHASPTIQVEQTVCSALMQFDHVAELSELEWGFSNNCGCQWSSKFGESSRW